MSRSATSTNQILKEHNALTVTQLAIAANVTPQTIRRAIASGNLRAAQSGEHGHFRISRTEAQEWWRNRGGGALWDGPMYCNTPQERAEKILQDLANPNSMVRNSAIVALAHADEETSEIVEAEVIREVAAYDGPEDDLSDWRALDTEPFRLPDEEPTP